jgi:uncharacterized BrkB/YihY/UPF0761 family membrane protein
MVFYAGVFVSIDIAYNVFEHQALASAEATKVAPSLRSIARRRSLVVLVSFMAAMLVAVIAPLASFGLICAALILHLRPDFRGFTNR